MKQISIVSPSGKFYGSEQVLFDFLSQTQNRYHVYLPQGLFYEKLQRQNKHFLHTFSSVKLLYVRLLFLLLINRYDGIYINEGGHVKYINFLAGLFSRKYFFVHIRLLEDCYGYRLGRSRRNISYVSVSEYITGEVMRNAHLQCTTLYDIYRPVSGFEGINAINLLNDVLHIGIIGRVTTTKGLHNISQYCEYCENHLVSFKMEFHFYGGIDEHLPEIRSFVERTESYKHIKCIFHGFVQDKKQIYQSIDILLHFNKVESLGRIVMEALDYGVPFIGFQSGGIGELAHQFGVEKYMIGKGDNWEADLQNRITDMITHKKEVIEDYSQAKLKMETLCNPKTYTCRLEELFYE